MFFKVMKEDWITCLIIGQSCNLFYQRYDSLLVLLLSTHHGVAFARSRLAVRKYTHVVAFEGMMQHLHPDVLVHLLLGGEADVLGLQRERERSRKREKR